MSTVEVVGVIVVCLVAVAAAAWVLVVLHQRRLISSVGGLAVAYRGPGKRWANGVGRYTGDQLLWYRTLSLSFTAAVRLPRSELQVISTRGWNARTDMALRPNLAIVECGFREDRIWLGFPDNGLMGFLSWLEASAPSP